MKNTLITVVCLFLVCCSKAQNVAINNTATLPDGSAMLDVSSTGKGILVPRMSTAQIGLISMPAKGLLVYDSVKNQLVVNIGTTVAPVWQNATASWNLTGNAGTNAAGRFLGTTDADPLRFRQKNQNAGIIDSVPENTALGFRALDSVTTGIAIAAFGYKALNGNTSGGDNVALGANAMRFNKTGDDNVATGTFALYHNISGIENNAYGTQALLFNIGGNDNTSFGTYSMAFNTTGSFNTALGEDALQNNQTGFANVAVGTDALFQETNRSFIVAIGDSALYNNGGSVFLPADATANTAVGSKALFSNTTGYNNTGIGYHSLYNLSGNNVTAIGANADAPGILSNATAIGANASVTQSNSIQLGDANVTAVKTAADVFVKNGKGLIRSSDGTQLKKLITTVGISANLAPAGIIAIGFTFSPEAFSNTPDVYVGNIVSGSGFTQLIMSVSNVTATGGILNIYNANASALLTDFVVKIIGIGAE